MFSPNPRHFISKYGIFTDMSTGWWQILVLPAAVFIAEMKKTVTQVIIIVLFLFVCQKRGGHETWPCGSFSVSLVSLCTSKKWNVVLLVLIVTVKNIFSCIRALMAIKREKKASHNAGLLNESIVTPTVCCSTDCVVSSNNGVLQECLCAAVFC